MDASQLTLSHTHYLVISACFLVLVILPEILKDAYLDTNWVKIFIVKVFPSFHNLIVWTNMDWIIISVLGGKKFQLT